MSDRLPPAEQQVAYDSAIPEYSDEKLTAKIENIDLAGSVDKLKQIVEEEPSLLDSTTKPELRTQRQEVLSKLRQLITLRREVSKYKFSLFGVIENTAIVSGLNQIDIYLNEALDDPTIRRLLGEVLDYERSIVTDELREAKNKNVNLLELGSPTYMKQMGELREKLGDINLLRSLLENKNGRYEASINLDHHFPDKAN